MIKADLQQSGELGLNEVLFCTGFAVSFDFQGSPKAIEFKYSKCIEGLNAEVREVASYVKIYTNEDKRQDRDKTTFEGLTETVQEAVLDQEGQQVLNENNEPVFETVTKPKLIGTLDYWLKMIGEDIIIPDLQTTLNSRVIEHKI